MLSIANKILSALPGNGKKTLIGGLVSIAVLFFPDFPVNEADAHKVIESLGFLYLIAGLLHKYVKAKLK